MALTDGCGIDRDDDDSGADDDGNAEWLGMAV